MQPYDKALAAELEAVMGDIPGAKAGKMFGMPGYKVNGKLAVGMFENSMVAKVGAARTADLWVGTASSRLSRCRGARGKSGFGCAAT
jgi:hypothetical protein